MANDMRGSGPAMRGAEPSRTRVNSCSQRKRRAGLNHHWTMNE